MTTEEVIEQFEKQVDEVFGDKKGIIIKSLQFANVAHAGQFRDSGEAYIIHPVCVAQILMKLRMDENTIAAALLHDVVEDTEVTQKQLKEEFGAEIEELVKGVTKIGNIKMLSKEEREMESLRRMFLVMAKDVRVIMIKIADRLHNMRTLQYLSFERQQKIASQTMDLFVPITERLGIGWIKDEMEELCFKYLYPDDYKRLSREMEKKYQFRVSIIESTKVVLEGILQELNIKGEVKSRIKKLYSIFKKGRSKGVDKIYDVIAHRFIVDEVKDCYALLGAVHNKFRPVPGRIKDYIALPKANMYQSLHTTVLTEDGVPFEVQIRTKEMHKVCEYGIAAHWKYKEGIKGSSSLDDKIAWIRKAVESEKDFKDSQSFVEAIKTDFRTNEIWVFTPKLKVVNLTEKSTPIDFAYAIHTDLGHKCIGAKVNGKIVPLTTKLETGDVVEIIVSQVNKGPSRDWLKVCVTASARNKIRTYFKKEMKDENIKIGKEMLELEAEKRGYGLSELLTDENVKEFKSKYNLLTLEDVYATVGCGGLTTNQILSGLVSKKRQEERRFLQSQNPNYEKKTSQNASSGILVDGKEDFLVRFAGCCFPVPGDEIVGFISQGKGITVHSKNCPNLKFVDQSRLIDVEWKKDTKDSAFRANINIVAKERPSLVAEITAIFSQMKVSMLGMTLDIKSKGIQTISARLNVKNNEELVNVISKLSKLEGVEKIYRK